MTSGDQFPPTLSSVDAANLEAGAMRTSARTDSGLRFPRFVVSLVMCVLMAACTARPSRLLPADVDAAWRTHRALLTDLTRWHLRASLSVRAGNDGGQANMDWHQREKHYDIRLSGPFGSGGVRLAGDSEGATLLKSNGERHSDSDPAQLLYQQLGWWIPVESLRYWAVGLPDPAMEATWSLDAYGRLASLNQNGWAVRFEAYRPSGPLDLPQKVTVRGHEAEVRVVARHWTVDLAQAR